MTYEISQVFVVFSGACLVSNFYMKEKYKQLILLLLASLFIGAHFFMFNSLTAGFLEVLCLARILLMFFTEKKNLEKYNIYLAITFSILSAIICYLTFNNWLSVVPTAGFAIFTILSAFKSKTLIRLSYCFHSICYGAYSFLIASYTAFAFYIIVLICSITMLIIADKSTEQKNTITTDSNQNADVESNNNSIEQNKVIENSNNESNDAN